MASVPGHARSFSAFPTEHVTGGEAVYWALRALDVRHVFGIVSVHNLPIFEAVDRLGGIRHVSTRHEQSAAHAADGYARVTGRLGVVIGSTGPGTTNTATGLLEAGSASSPVLLITGQTASTVLGKGKGYVHEFEQQLAMLRTLVPHAESVRSRHAIGETILHVARRILTGRPQPGAVQIPIDYQWAHATERETEWVAPAPRGPSAASIDAAVGLLDVAMRPVIWAGGGVTLSNGSRALHELTDRLAAPVFVTENARGSLPHDHPSYMGMITDQPGAWEIMRESDAMVAIGTRFQWTATAAWKAPVPDALVHLDVDPRMIGLNYRPAVAMVGDARRGMDALLERLVPHDGDAAFLERARQVRAKLEEEFEHQAGADYRTMRDGLLRHLPDDAVITSDATMATQMFGRRLIPMARPRSSTHVSTAAIGPGAATALGAAVGAGVPTILFQGDGGFMMSIGELATMAEMAARVIVLVFNDRGYGAIRMLQSMTFGERLFSTELATPNFAQVARAMGVESEHVGTAAEFEAAFGRAIQADGPYLLDIDISNMPSTSPVEWRKRSPNSLGGDRFDRG